ARPMQLPLSWTGCPGLTATVGAILPPTVVAADADDLVPDQLTERLRRNGALPVGCISAVHAASAARYSCRRSRLLQSRGAADAGRSGPALLRRGVAHWGHDLDGAGLLT